MRLTEVNGLNLVRGELAHKVFKDFRVSWVQLDSKASKETKVVKDSKETKVVKDSKDFKVVKASKVSKDS
jgi:hypothetical protein